MSFILLSPWLHRMALCLIGLLVDGALGDPRWLWGLIPHPVVLIGRLIGAFDRAFNRPERDPGSQIFAGFLTTVFVVSVAALVGVGVMAVSAATPWGLILEGLSIAILVAQRDLYIHVWRVRRALETRGLEAGRREVSHIVGRDPESLDIFGVSRAAIETLAENFGDGVVAPVFWYLLLGPPGLFAYKAINTLDSMIGHRSYRYKDFGMVAARLDDVANLIPARLAGVLIAFAALLMPSAKAGAGLKTMFRDARLHRSPNAGWPEAAMAGALGLALAGPRRYAHGLVRDPWIGDGRARALPADIGRALGLYTMACVLMGLLILGGLVSQMVILAKVLP